MIIGKFHLGITDHQTLQIPAPANILSVINQKDSFGRDNVVLYAEMQKDADYNKREIRMYGTGHEMDKVVGKFIGTVSTDEGALIWHVYDVTDYLAEDHYS